MTPTYIKHDDVLKVFTQLMIANRGRKSHEELLSDAEVICAMVRSSFGSGDIKPYEPPKEVEHED